MLSAFADRAWFCLYRLTPREGGKLDKVPVGIDGRNSNAQDPSTWMLPVFAEAYAGALGCGTGIVLHPRCQLACIDLDHCVSPTGELTVFAQTIIAMFPGAFVELSVSGTGVHIFFSYTGELGRHGTRGEGIEVYTTGRFVALGTQGQGDPHSDHTAMLHVVLATLVNQPAPTQASAEWTDGPDPEFRGGGTDEQIIASIRAQVVPRGDGASGRALWDCDIDALALAYAPGRTGEAYNASAADQALANMLARSTGYDCERTARLLTQSGLARDKHEREDYIRRTVLRACDGLAKARETWRERYGTEVFASPHAESLRQHAPIVGAPPGVAAASMVSIASIARAQPVPNTSVIIDGAEPKTVAAPATRPAPKRGAYLLAAEMQQLFEGCVYVTSEDAVLTRNNELLTERQFNRRFSNACNFQITVDNAKPTKSAWTGFHESEVYAPEIVDRSYFNPNHAPRAVRHYGADGRELNSWAKPDMLVKEGDVSRYLRVLEAQFPDERDRRIFVSWMASCVQNPGKKFRWSPYLQGKKGCGKSTHSSILAYAVGNDYAAFPTAKHLDKQFNSMLDRKVLVCVDDINLSDRGGLWDTLKPMITETKLEIERKGVDSFTSRDMCLKFLFNGNYKDGLPMSDDERRLAPFFIKADKHQMVAAGLVPSFYRWLEDEEGYAYVTHYLLHYPVAAEFDPAKECVVAPVTTNTAEAIQLSKRSVEQYLEEAIESGAMGASDRVSAVELDTLLRIHQMASKIPLSRRPELMASVGFTESERTPPDAAGKRHLMYVRPKSSGAAPS